MRNSCSVHRVHVFGPHVQNFVDEELMFYTQNVSFIMHSCIRNSCSAHKKHRTWVAPKQNMSTEHDTRQESYYPSSHHHACHLWRSGDNQSEGSLVPMVSRWLWPGNRTFLEVAYMVATWRIVAFLCSVSLQMGPWCDYLPFHMS